MKKKNIILILSFMTIFCCLFFIKTTNIVYADELSDSISDQVDNLDLTSLEDFFSDKSVNGFDFFSFFKGILSGEYNGTNNFSEYIKNVVLSDVISVLPIFISLIAVVFLIEIVNRLSGSLSMQNVGTILKFVSILAVVLFLSYEFISIWKNVKNLIQNIGFFTEIMSPIILTLMVASGGNGSAAIFKPSVLIFSDFIISLFNFVVLPLIGVMVLFNLISFLSSGIKIKKFSDFFGGILKWIFGIVIIVYGFIISVQGLTVSNIDGISVKIAKYALSNSIPIVGGLVKDGLDVVTAGSIIIKNAVGLTGITGVFLFLLSPVIHIAVFSLGLKLSAAIIDLYSDGFVPDFLATVSKSISYLVASLLTVALLSFLIILLMVFSANSVF